MQVSKLLEEAVRSDDILARWGGEEFILLLPNQMHEQAKLVAEKLCKLVHDTPFHYEEDTLNVTMTIGVAHIRKEETIDGCIRRADSRLYEGKRKGRNRVIVADPNSHHEV